MSTAAQKLRTVSLTERESAILEIVNTRSHCSSSDVNDALPGNQELLLVMRAMHSMVERGLLERVVIDEKRVYRLRPNYLRRKANRIPLR
jgi:hypothetical protein